MIYKTVIMMGYACNNRCIFCYNDHKRNFKEKTTQEILRDMASARKHGSDYLELIGGEPTIRPDIMYVVSAAKKLGFETIMFATNGRMFSNPEFAKKLVKKGLNHVVFSIHGHEAGLHDGLTQVKGSFNELVKGVENIKDLIRIGSNTTIVRHNYKHLKKIGLFIQRLGITDSEFIFVDPTQGAPKKDFEMVPTYEEVRPYVNDLLKLGKDMDHWHIRYYPLCFIDRKYHDQVSELHEEKIFVSEHVAPDFINPDIVQARKDISRVKIDKCKGCVYDDKCEGYWREYVKWR